MKARLHTQCLGCGKRYRRVINDNCPACGSHEFDYYPVGKLLSKDATIGHTLSGITIKRPNRETTAHATLTDKSRNRLIQILQWQGWEYYTEWKHTGYEEWKYKHEVES